MANKNLKILIILFILLNYFFIGLCLSAESNSVSKNNPYFASVRVVMKDTAGGTGFCSGTIIGESKEKKLAQVLTAGHCIKNIGKYQQQMQSGSYYQRNIPPPNWDYYYVDFGPGTRQVSANLVAGDFDPDPYAGKVDIGLLTIPIDINNPPKYSELVPQTYVQKVGENVYDIGYPGGEDLSIVGCKIRELVDSQKGAGFSVVNFPPRGGRSGGGIFVPTPGKEVIYNRGNIFGIMTNVDPNKGAGIYSNPTQIYSFLNKYKIQIYK